MSDTLRDLRDPSVFAVRLCLLGRIAVSWSPNHYRPATTICQVNTVTAHPKGPSAVNQAA